MQNRVDDIFAERTRQELQRAQRYCLFLSVVVLDLSEFSRAVAKRSTDQKVDLESFIGQLEGGIKSTLRSSDIVTRCDSQRIALLLVETSKTGLDAVTERLQPFIVDSMKSQFEVPFEPRVQLDAASFPEEGDRFLTLIDQFNGFSQS